MPSVSRVKLDVTLFSSEDLKAQSSHYQELVVCIFAELIVKH